MIYLEKFRIQWYAKSNASANNHLYVMLLEGQLYKNKNKHFSQRNFYMNNIDVSNVFFFMLYFVISK